MIVNSSRFAVAKTCWRRAFNQFHRRLGGPTSMNLVDGGATHDGIAHGLATKDWTAAVSAARARFDREAASATIPAEQSYLLEEHWNVVVKMLECYRDNYEVEGYQVIQPECLFDVALPGSWHNCIMLHWCDHNGEEHWGEPPAEQILAGIVHPVHTREDPRCACYTPHRVAGKTDCVVSWHNNIWLLEHKTTAIDNEQFWAQWDLDIQPTTYIYGIWKAMAYRPRGVIVNAIKKPSEAQVNGWNSKRKYGPAKTVVDYIGYERRAFLRGEEDLARVERQYINLCDEWEWRVARGNFDMSPIRGACIAYNRRCDFHMACVAHEESGTMNSFEVRKDDYIQDKQRELLVQINGGVKREDSVDF